MLKPLLSSGTRWATNDSANTRRRHPRRGCDRCVSVVNGTLLPVLDWSPGGALVNGDDRMFRVGEEVEVTLKFKLERRILDIDHKARIIRKGRNKIALQFIPLTETIWRGFQRVIDEHVTREFANSQLV
ncbi:MAG: PilZ domain-containing protein [Alphaproteobacteria bacterium]|nr:PilZ domain-containing protein [Alphaproteobacteria bacterium]